MSHMEGGKNRCRIFVFFKRVYFPNFCTNFSVLHCSGGLQSAHFLEVWPSKFMRILKCINALT